MREFGKLEATVMDCVWLMGRPISVRDVLTELQKSRDIAYTTVMTVMDTLHRKGWLRRRLDGRAYAYEAVASREAYTARLMRGALATSNNQAAAFVHFLADLTPAEANALREALKIVPQD